MKKQKVRSQTPVQVRPSAPKNIRKFGLLCAALVGFYVVQMLSGCVVKPYIQGGVSWHDASLAKPEVQLDSKTDILGHIELGIDAYNISIYARHTSSIDITEHGGGVNEIGVYKRIYFITPWNGPAGTVNESLLSDCGSAP